MKAKRCILPILVCLLAGASAGSAGTGEQDLIEVLRSAASLHEKARACEQLAVAGSKEAVPLLADLLGDADLGEYARFALEPIDDPGVDDAFRAALGRLEGVALAGVVNSIGVRRDAKAVGALSELVTRVDQGVGPEALVALGRIATPEAIGAIRRALAGGPPELRIAAADAALAGAEGLKARQQQADAVALYDALRVAELPSHVRVSATYGALTARGADALPLLTDLLADSDPAMVQVALRAARELPGADTTRALARELGNSPPLIQAQLIRVLEDRGDAGAREGIEALAAGGEPAVRLAALKALASIGNAASVKTLVKALDADGAESAVAGAGLRALKAEGVDDELLNGLPGAEGVAHVELIGVVADRGLVRATPLLLEDAVDPDENIAKAAFKALGDLARPEDLQAIVRAFLSTRSPAVRPAAESALVKVASGNANTALAALASASSPTERASLLRVLGRIGGEDAYQAIAEASADAEPEVKDAAVRALAAWPDGRATDALLDLARNSADETHRVLALRGYVRLLGMEAGRRPEETAVKFAAALALAKTAETRKAVLGALVNVPHRAALAVAMACVDDADVRTEAELAAVTLARVLVGTDREDVRAAMTRVAGSPDARAAGDAREILALLDRFGDAIVAWRIDGPYTAEGNDYRQLFDIAFAPEKGGPGVMAWRALPAGTDPGHPWLMDLLKIMPGEQRVAYALTWVHSDVAQPARLELGSDDGVKAWLNDKLVHANNVARAAEPYTDRADIELQAGWNSLLLKITQNNDPWAFCARICRRDGQMIENIRVDPWHEGD